MKKIAKILLKIIVCILILAVVAAAAVFIFVGKENVIAAIKGLTTTTEDIEKNIQQTEKKQVEDLQNFGFNISDEDMQKIQSGELTEQEVVDKLLGKENSSVEDDVQSDETQQENQTDKEITDIAEQPGNDDGQNEATTDSGTQNVKTPSGKVETPTQKPDSSKQPEKQPDTDKTKTEKTDSTAKDTPKKDDGKNSQKTDKTDKPVTDTKKEEPVKDVPKENEQKTETPKSDSASSEYDEKIAALVAKMYVYKSQYTGQISSLVGAMSQEYYRLPADQQVYSNKVSIYNRYANQIAQMEAQCDAQVNALVTELRSLLKASGKDESLAESLMAAYNAEKENSKAYYISRYAD